MNISLVILPSLVTNTYASNNGLLQKSAYANGDAIRYAYTNSGLVSQIFVDNNGTSANPSFTWNYSSNGLPRAHKDGITGYKYDYSYDSIGRLIRTDISKSSDSSYVASTEYGYDVRNNLTSIVNDIGGIAYKQIYGYYNTGVGNAAEDTKDNLPTRYIVLNVNTDYTYDSLNKLTKKTVDTTSNDLTNQYFYYTTTKNNATYYTNQLKCEVIEGVSYHFGYDKVGNITSIGKGTGASSTASSYREYTYDALNRLLTDTRYDQDTMSTYTYNHLGNITSKTNTNAAGTTTKSKIEYGYAADSDAGWNYLLTKLTFKDSNDTITKTETIDYDAIGNPISYRGATLNWYGRQMKSFAKNGVTSTMTYDADGLRSTKTVGTTKTEYQYVGDKLFYEDRGNGDSFYYFYDSYGKLAALYHNRNGTKVAYHVVTNSQGDVVALYSWTGTKVAEYSYDAWGNCIIVSDTSSTGIATLNPFRYRGYYFDTDLGLYYLQSRYYDATIGRFINADGYVTTGQGVMSYNMYAYCQNNPVMYSDPSGRLPIWVIAVVVACVVSLSSCSKSSKNAPQKTAPSTVSETKQLDLTPKQKEDKHNLALTIYGEQHGTSVYDDWKEGQEAVAWTIINRYNSPSYTNDWTSIVTAKDQFTGYSATAGLSIESLDPMAWDYANILAENMVTGNYDNISYPVGFTDKHMNFRTDEGQSFEDWEGIVRIAGNVFFSYK